jgi:acyl-CoA thioester hydrolase
MPSGPDDVDAFTFELRVRYHEADAQGIVYHSRYLEYLDIALTEYVRALGMDYVSMVKQGFDPSIVETRLQFHAPALFEDVIEVAVQPTHVGTSSLTIDFTITRREPETCLVTARTVYVNLDVETKTPKPIPPQIRAKLTAGIPSHTRSKPL